LFQSSIISFLIKKITIRYNEGSNLKKIILALALLFTMPFMLQAKTNTDVQFTKHASHASKSKLTKYLIKKIYNKKVKHFRKVKHGKNVKYATTLNKKYKGAGKRVLRVTATAYTSRKRETQGDPTIAAWGAKLRPGDKTIAISRDLLKKGMGNGTRVTIDGLKGTYIVRDKMAARWRNKIDIYMGYNLKKALKWGRKKVVIRWA
jgi:3D (Asp-Asp-Asp) domain-containing protein